MTRMTVPTPTRGPAPSHSPPDVHYAPGFGLAKMLGWFSIGLGVAELLAPRPMSRMTGIGRPGLVQAYGLREIACGVGILASAQPAKWLWARAAGDALDLATLGGAIAQTSGEQRRNSIVAAVVVSGVAALDLASATALEVGSRLEG